MRFKHPPRMAEWWLMAAVLIQVIALISPQQLPVALYKLALIALAAVLGYWLDRSLFPYARPDGYLTHDWRHSCDAQDGDADFRIASGYHWPFCVAMLRRALLVGAVIVGVAMGL